MFNIPDIGVNSGLIFVIITITEFIKKLDKKKKFKKFYILIPLILGIGASFLVTQDMNVKDIIINGLVYAGVSGYFYKSGKTIIEGKKNAGTKEKDRRGTP